MRTVDAFLESQRIVPGSLSHLYPPYDDHRAEDEDDEASGLSLAALTVSVAQAGQMLGISRAEAFRRAKSGELAPGVPVLLLGPRLTRVSKCQLEEYLARRAQRLRRRGGAGVPRGGTASSASRSVPPIEEGLAWL